jgi:serine/threonine protein kinase
LQICSAIHYLGTEELVHLDIKPRNIIMGAPPRVIDLSIARSFERAAKITGTVGTDAYMAPEQCDPQRATIGPAADIYGLGATLHHCLSGKVPFPRPDYDRERDKDHPSARWPQLYNDPEPLPRTVPPMLIDLVRACMDPDPALRPTASAIVETIEPMVIALPTKPVLRRARPGRRRP